MTPQPMARPVVVLFDVDETLVHTGGAGARSWRDAFDEIYGIPADIGAHTSAGETDPEVARETFVGAVGRSPTDVELGRLYGAYLLHLTDELATGSGYRVLPGAEATLRDLGAAGVLLGVVSGAMEGAARAKLARGDLSRYFVFGGYGSDAPDRGELTSMAIEKAARLHRGLDPSAVAVVGDTPRDIDAAHAAGAMAVGVATGKYGADDLTAAGADHVLGSLEEPFPGV